MNKFIIILFLQIFTFGILSSQNSKKPLDFSVYNNWKYIKKQSISDNGEWIAYEKNPYKGNGKLLVVCPNKNIRKIIDRGYSSKISPNSNFIIFKIKPQYDTIRKLRLAKTKKNKLPKDSLGIWVFGEKKVLKIKNIKSYKTSKEKSDWIAYTLKKKIKKSKKDKKRKKKKVFDKNAPKTNSFVIYNPITKKSFKFDNISEYNISENGQLISFVKLQNDSLLKSTIYTFDTKQQKSLVIFDKKGLAKKLSISNNGEKLAFLFSTDTTKNKIYDLFYWDKKQKTPKSLKNNSSKNTMPKNWSISVHGSIYFSKDNSKLYFGTAPKPEKKKKDTLLPEEKVKLDVWSWKDPLLQPQQLAELKKEKTRNYLAVYHINSNKIIQLASKEIPQIRVLQNGNSSIALGISNLPYRLRFSWIVPYFRDIYTVDIQTGEKKLFKKEVIDYTNISPFGKYIYWYSNSDSSWYSYSIANKITKNLTKNIPSIFYNDEDDYPDAPNPYYFAGWTKNDEYFLVYSKFDIWMLDPSGKKNAKCLTNQTGKKNNIVFRNIRIDRKTKYIDITNNLLLKAFNKKNKQSGFYLISPKKGLKKLVIDDYSFSSVSKAKKSNKIIWKKENFKTFGDLWYSNIDLSKRKKVSNANPQQKKYIWGNVEIVNWLNFDGKKESGLLYKPENFDPKKKYPVIVYFYRLHTDDLHRHYVPKPSRSIINPSFYTSNGYIVFMPNIRYKTGYPGESSFNYVVSGTLNLTKYSYIDKNNIGIQGQSWGGYQVAYIITKTNLYKAASAGAPVTNMTSAYGGIRWKSGMSRMFQYEQTQSRIGGTLWEKPFHYIENSPIFYAPKVNTPLLIRHNDNDGAVPWYQGIEYFVALRRLGKPVWLLNYNGAPHNERAKSPNTYDLSIRMKQFFDHYLKGKPAPIWMTDGIPATKKGKTLGYDLKK